MAGHETATLKEARFYEALDEVNETKDECFSNTIIGGKGSEICHQLAKLREDVKSVRNILSENERQGSKEQNCNTGVQGHEKNKLVMSSNTLKNEQYQIVARDNSVNFDKDMLIKTSLGGAQAEILIDTGSQVTIIGKTFWEKLSQKGQCYSAQYETIIGVGGNRFQVIGTTVLETIFDGREIPIEYHILAGTNFDAILGRDFLNKYVETMNWSCGQMILKCDMVEKTVKSKSINTTLVDKVPTTSLGRLVRQQVIRPGQQKWVQIYPIDNICSRNVEIINLENQRNDISIIRSIQDGTLGEMPCLLKNA